MRATLLNYKLKKQRLWHLKKSPAWARTKSLTVTKNVKKN